MTPCPFSFTLKFNKNTNQEFDISIDSLNHSDHNTLNDYISSVPIKVSFGKFNIKLLKNLLNKQSLSLKEVV